MFLLAVLLLTILTVQGCIDICTQQFNSDMQAALMGDTAIATAMSCTAITNHIQCLQRVEASCKLNSSDQMLHYSTLSMARQKYSQFCQGVSGRQDVANCGGQYMVCNEQLNSTFNVAVATFDIQKACISLNNYSSCVENMITLPNCGQLSHQAMRTVALLMSKYGPSCQADTIKEGQVIASCMNRTMQCLDEFKETFSIAVNASDMPTMCQALSRYTTCIEDLRQNTTCSRYVIHALMNIDTLRSQHRVACGPDNGVRANECLHTYKTCYGHFNHSFGPPRQGRHHGVSQSEICSSLSRYTQCVARIPQDCHRYIGKPTESLNLLKRQYSQYCDPDFQRMMDCSVLVQCNTDLIGNITTGMNDHVASMCSVLEHYFRCVDKAVKVCDLGRTEKSISFRDLGLVASRYCKTILANCVDLMVCHVNYNMTTATPAMLVDGVYWCRYLQSVMTCSQRMIMQDHCPDIDKASVPHTFEHLESMMHSTCTPEAQTTEPPLTFTPRVSDNKQRSNHPKRNSAEMPRCSAFAVAAIVVMTSLLFTPLGTS